MLFYQAMSPQPEPQARPAWVQDTPEEAAEEAKRLAAVAASAARARAASSGVAMFDTDDDDASDGADATTSEQAGTIPEHVLTAFGKQAAPERRVDGSEESDDEWPTRLVLKVHLPGVTTHKDIEAEVDGQQLRLTAAQGRYSMLSTLPFAVNPKFSGEFDTSNNTLALTLPVLPVPRVPPSNSAAPAEPPVPPPPPPPPRRVGQTPAALELRAAIHAHRRRDTSSSSSDES
jgi:HSP20 family molecular chaperone IbpA